jgi:hypothetical protein
MKDGFRNRSDEAGLNVTETGEKLREGRKGCYQLSHWVDSFGILISWLWWFRL